MADFEDAHYPLDI